MEFQVERQTSIPEHVIQFGRFLREHSFYIGHDDIYDLLTTYKSNIPESFSQQQDLYRALFVKNRKQLLVFDELYREYWKKLAHAENSKTKTEEETKPQKKRTQSAPSIYELKDWLYNGKISTEKEISAHSALEALGQKDFSIFLKNEHSSLKEIIRLIARRLSVSYNRRWTHSNKKQNIDLKLSIRSALRQGGEINRFYFKEKQRRKVNLILLCDVSKSMELYSQFLIEFMYNFQQTVFSLKTFVFSTRLISLTRILRDGDYEQVLNNLSSQVPYWSGGTRIGQSFSEFTRFYSHQIYNNSVVMIMSDGWDTGNIEELEEAMIKIHKKSKKIIWLNPLAGNPNYKPDTAGMKTCMPYIDVFGSAHNVDSLKEVAKKIV